jgi:hypothetical protein
LHPDDTFMVYFAGHGTLDLTSAGTQHHLLTSESSLSAAAETGIPRALLEERLDGLSARRRVVVLDTCFSGGGRSQLAPETLRALQQLRGPAPAPDAPRFSRYEAWLFAAVHHQPAQEDPELGNGVYTHHLIQGLEGPADYDGDGLVDVLEAHQWALEGTLAHTGGSQVPLVYTERAGRSDIFLSGDPRRRSQAEWAVLSLDRLPAGAELRVDGVLRRGGSVAPGRHHIQVQQAGDTLLDERLDLRAGDWLDLGERVASGGLGGLAPSWRFQLQARLGAEGFWGKTALAGGLEIQVRLGRRLWLGAGAGSSWVPYDYSYMDESELCELMRCRRWVPVFPLHAGPRVQLAEGPMEPYFGLDLVLNPLAGFADASVGARGRWGMQYLPRPDRPGLVFDAALGIIQDMPVDYDSGQWLDWSPSWQVGVGAVYKL